MDKKAAFPLFCLLAFLAFGFSPAATGSSERHNVLLITIDTLRADRLGCYDSKRTFTPHLDSLARRGVLFTRAFAHTPTTLPSHANILLGTTPLSHGVHENVNFVVPDPPLTLAEHLKEFGYHTGAFVGAYPLDSRFGLAQGFDLYDDFYERTPTRDFLKLERRAEAVVDNALSWLEGAGSLWFLWVHCFDPHTPYDPPGPFKFKFKGNLYNGEVAYVDSILGELFDYLEQHRLWEKTLVILTGDHGESLGEHGEETHGFFAYNSTLWVPLILSIPGGAPSRVDQAVGHIDLFPTVCDILRIEKPVGLQGLSLLPVIEGKSLPERSLYIESLFPYYSHGWAPLRGFIRENEKFIDSPTPELYNLDLDFKESKNLAKKARLEGYQKELDRLIEEFSSAESSIAETRADRDKLEKLQSLGYVSGSRLTPEKEFGPKDDVKVLFPYFKKTQQAWKLYEQGNAEEAEEILRNILVERKDMGMSYVYLARILRESGRLKNALSLLEPGLRVLPDNYDIFTEYLNTLLLGGRYDEVIAAIDRASYREIDLDPEIWNNLGICYSRKGELELAIQAFEMALSLDGNYSETLDNLGRAHYSLSIQTDDLKRLDRALEFFQRAIAVSPEFSSPHKGAGDVYFSLEDYGKAISSYERAIDLEPENGIALYKLGLAFLNQGNREKALTYLLKVKNRYYRSLSEAQRKKLDELIKHNQP